MPLVLPQMPNDVVGDGLFIEWRTPLDCSGVDDFEVFVLRDLIPLRGDLVEFKGCAFRVRDRRFLYGPVEAMSGCRETIQRGRLMVYLEIP